MKKKLLLRSTIAVAVIGICLYLVFPLDKSINKGLDIAGGMHFNIEVLLDDIDEDKKKDAMESALAVYRNRIDEIGVAGTTVEQAGTNHIIVQIPGVETKEAERIRDILIRTAHLEFKLVVDGPGEPIMVN
ncbi:MAG: hypothetical protein SV775_19885 [Thermodesulfobacteriota bacterium]|nr:hypothetical protein [Thermodesulfobacteriota bacterium]